MTGKTNALELAVANHLLGGAAMTRPTGPFTIALLTADLETATNAASLAGVELSGGGYARQTATFTNGASDADIEFGPVTGANWTGITHFAIIATGNDQVVYLGTATGAPVTVPVGIRFRIAAGQLTINEG